MALVAKAAKPRPMEKPAKWSFRKSLINCPCLENEGGMSGRIFLKLGEVLRNLNFYILFGINENRYSIPKPTVFEQRHNIVHSFVTR